MKYWKYELKQRILLLRHLTFPVKKAMLEECKNKFKHFHGRSYNPMYFKNDTNELKKQYENKNYDNKRKRKNNKQDFYNGNMNM